MYIKEVEIIGTAQPAPLKRPRLWLHTPEGEFQPIAIMTIDVTSDYIKQFTDYILTEIVVTLATYTKVVEIANQGILEATLTNGPVSDARYRALVAPTKDLPNTDALNSIKDDALDQTLMTITLQLVNLSAEAISLTHVGGVYTGLNRTDLVRAAINEAQAQMNVSYPIEVLSVVEGDNPAIISQEVVESHTPLLKIVSVVQKKLGGLYTGGANIYFSHYKEQSHCYVFPPLTNRWSTTEASKRLILWDLFDSAGSYRDRTYNIYPEDSDQLNCIVNQQVRSSESNETRASVRANGFRAVSPENMMEGVYSISSKTVTSNASRTDARVVMGNRTDGYNAVVTGTETITSNPYDAISGVRANRGKTLRFTWQNSYPKALYPGMPIKIVSENKDTLVERYGSLIYAFTAFTRVGGLKALIHKQVTYLVVFVDEENPSNT